MYYPLSTDLPSKWNLNQFKSALFHMSFKYALKQTKRCLFDPDQPFARELEYRYHDGVAQNLTVEELVNDFMITYSSWFREKPLPENVYFSRRRNKGVLKRRKSKLTNG